MAFALARTQAVFPQNGNVAVELDIALSGPDVIALFGDGRRITANVEFPGDAQPAAIRTAMSAGVTAAAAAVGVTVIGANMVLPTFQKG